MKKKIVLAAFLISVGVALVIGLSGPTARSVQGASPQIVLYTGENFTGRSITVEGTIFDFPKFDEPDGSQFDWNDQVRSLVVVGGTWRIYQNGRCNTRLDDTALQALDIGSKQPDEGWSALVSATSTGQLEVSDLSFLGLGKDISSVELVSQTNLPDWALAMRKP
jgi:hypothetical protein